MGFFIKALPSRFKDLCGRGDGITLRPELMYYPSETADTTRLKHMNSETLAAHTRPAQVHDRWGPSTKRSSGQRLS